jgi:hypothetical protein
MKTEQESKIEAAALQDAIASLKKFAEFEVYQKEIKELVKTIAMTIVNTKPMDDKSIKKLIYMQGQLDILVSVYGISIEQVIEEVNEQEFA